MSSPIAPQSALPPPVRIPLTVVPAQPCPYLPGRTSQVRAFSAQDFPGDLYQGFMDANFRRSGMIFYQPICPGCQACMQIRVPVERFVPDKSQRRCRRRNSDLEVTASRPLATDEKYDLYRRYVSGRHSGTLSEDTRSGFEAFLYRSPIDTIEMCYRDRQGRLLAVGICDVSLHYVSSVYFYFDPAESRRGLGTYGALCEIETARRLGIAWYYLGYWIAGCRAMEYKAGFHPCEVLSQDGVWRALAEAQTRQAKAGVD